jgi:hypothetical protein
MVNCYLQKEQERAIKLGLLLLEVFPAFLGLTHTVTHTRKKADGDNGRESAKDHAPLQQKCPESAEQQHFQGFQSLGKDEVPSSNLGSSSRKSSFSCGKGWIFLMFQNFFCWFEFLDLDLTTQPATDREKRLTGGDIPLVEA